MGKKARKLNPKAPPPLPTLWVTKEKKTVKIGHMLDSHIQNTVLYLEKRMKYMDQYLTAMQQELDRRNIPYTPLSLVASVHSPSMTTGRLFRTEDTDG